MDISERLGVTGLIFLLPTVIAGVAWLAIAIDGTVKVGVTRARIGRARAITLVLAIITGALFIAATWTHS